MRSSVIRLFALGTVIGLAGCGQSVPAPSSYKEFSAKNGTFSCSAPSDWDVEGGDGTRTEYSMCTFTKGAASIRVEADLAGSLHADIAKSANARMGGEVESPVAAVHALKISSLKDEFTNYKEREAKPFQSKGLGEGRKAIFIADGGMVGKMYGYHATLLTGDKRLTILCQCPATNWKVLRPAFDKILLSMSR